MIAVYNCCGAGGGSNNQTQAKRDYSNTPQPKSSFQNMTFGFDDSDRTSFMEKLIAVPAVIVFGVMGLVSYAEGAWQELVDKRFQRSKLNKLEQV